MILCKFIGSSHLGYTQSYETNLVHRHFGPLAVTLKNDTTMSFPSIEVVELVFAYIPVFPEQTYKPGDVFSAQIRNVEVLRFIEFDDVKIDHQLSEDILSFTIPNNAKAGSQFKMVSSLATYPIV